MGVSLQSTALTANEATEHVHERKKRSPPFLYLDEREHIPKRQFEHTK